MQGPYCDLTNRPLTAKPSTQQSVPNRHKVLLTSLKSLWRGITRLVGWMFANPNEPYITEFRDRHTGQLRWRVYFPANDTTLVFDSPEEVCTWIEDHWWHTLP
ncbi:hypothetical protein H6G89_16265 [Oscillatoria sp. FACHB-1407]|uniref:hypothetical protein n=1 Tax=Oscillatoria sp. FACHB-1407 TaxID=2692847 RepID=UPI0016897056|nr:hypothetical protein [Oscillatoria sp. FACHB-1407]MBD2462596.1 hypothetical protein [Oscillatoria sp. FACHB-1407]